MLLCVLMSWPLVYFIFNSVFFPEGKYKRKGVLCFTGDFVFFCVGFQLTSFRAVCRSGSPHCAVPRALSAIPWMKDRARFIQLILEAGEAGLRCSPWCVLCCRGRVTAQGFSCSLHLSSASLSLLCTGTADDARVCFSVQLWLCLCRTTRIYTEYLSDSLFNRLLCRTHRLTAEGCRAHFWHKNLSFPGCAAAAGYPVPLLGCVELSALIAETSPFSVMMQSAAGSSDQKCNYLGQRCARPFCSHSQHSHPLLC